MKTSCVKNSLTFPALKTSLPLPPCPGPQMRPFSEKDVSVHIHGPIGIKGVHSHVFEVTIDSKRYALKLFRTWCTRAYAPELENWAESSITVTEEDLRDHYQPFYNECRAYGRIEERRATDRYWKCYGYLRLPAHMRPELYQVTGISEYHWQVRPFEPYKTFEDELDWPIFGLVKELAPADADPVNVRVRSPRQMLGDLRLLHKMGIFNRDLAGRNYIDGRMIDFSSALTTPHIGEFSQHLPGMNMRAYRLDDIGGFNEVIRESGLKTTVVIHAGFTSHKQSTRAGRRWREINPYPPPSPFWELGVAVPTYRRRTVDSGGTDDW